MQGTLCKIFYFCKKLKPHQNQIQKFKLVYPNLKNKTKTIELFLIDLIAQIIIPIIVIKVLVFNKNSKIKPNFIEKSKGYTTIGNVKLIYNSERKLTKMNQVILSKAKNNWNE